MNNSVYIKWKNITDRVYKQEITHTLGALKLFFLIQSEGIKLRPGHTSLGFSFFVYDKEDYARKLEKPLGLGIIYKKPNGIKTQDIYIINPSSRSGKIEKYYSEVKMIKKYPSMKGTHKKNLPI